MAMVLEKLHPGTAHDSLPGPIGFIGAGKVGTALAALLHARGVDVAAVSGRTLTAGRRMALSARLEPHAASERADTLSRSAIVFLTVPDDDIGPLCQEIADEGGWRPGQGVVHCSGALPSSVLDPARQAGARVASFHPLQTFASLDAAMSNMPGSTFALEGDPELVTQLQVFAELLDGTALLLQPEEKTLYHAAASIASNYTVTLAALASELLVTRGVAPDRNTALKYLLPLLGGTLNNLRVLGLPGALTGALARGDVGTVTRHIEALEACTPDVAQLYRHLARLTLPLAAEKGNLDRATLDRLNRTLDGEPEED